jgi:transcriptional regulator with XRE-family HTH domain
MELGSKIRELRNIKNMTIKELASKSNLSIGMISQIERDKIGLSVASLWKISKALKVSIGYFLDEEKINNNPVVKKDERKRLMFANSTVIYELLTPNLTGKLEYLRLVIEPGESNNVEQISHRGEESGFVLQGKLLVRLGNEEYILEEGDSIHFKSTTPHNFTNIGEKTSISIWAVTPPSF